MGGASIGGLRFLLRRWVYIPVLFVMFLLSSCYAEALLSLNRVEEALVDSESGLTVINRNMYSYFLFGDSEYYFHIKASDEHKDARPNILVPMLERAEVRYTVQRFIAQETFAESSLSSIGHVSLFVGDIYVPGTPCRSFPCAVYWLEDRENGEIFVGVNGF